MVGPYRLEARLGVGGMGEVYRGYDDRLERRVALKKIRRDVVASAKARRRFEREARAVARLKHPNIVELHDFISDKEGDWIVMQYVEGRSLADVVDGEALDPANLVEISKGLASALASAHAKGIVHRDLKATNVMLTAEGQPKVLDFGLAKEIERQAGGDSESITSDGQVVGTPHAMSPEQAMGRRVDVRSDLFSLGSLIYHLATGTPPFAAESALAVLHRICSYEPPPIHSVAPGYPGALSELVARLLEKNPGHRPANAGAVAADLERIAALLARGDVELTADSPAADGIAERRQLTILECLLSRAPRGERGGGAGSEAPRGGWTASEASIVDFEAQARRVVEGLDGYVARCEGHRLEVYFGYPWAQEDAARRAVHAAGEIAKLVASLPAEDGDVLSIRAGVHTGPAIVYPKLEEPPVLGRTSDIASSLVRAADSGEILVSDTVRRLVVDAYAIEDSHRDVADASAFRISHNEGTGVLRFAATPLLARATELGLLLDQAARAREGVGQVALIHGEAGIGKSRLLAGLKEDLETLSMRWLLAQASPIYRASPLQPVIGLIESLLEGSLERGRDGNGEKASIRARVAALEAMLADGARDRSVPLLANLIGLKLTDPYVLPEVTPQKLRELTLQALVDLLLELAKEHPLALVIEDLHWADPTTVDWLGRLIEAARRSKLMLILTFRPAFEAPWAPSEQLLRLDLGRLTGRDTDRLIEHLTEGRSLPPALRDQIVAKTDGVPLFVEELTKSVLESGMLIEKDGVFEIQGPVDKLAIPATLRDSLMARLDRLGRAKSVAQLAATIGREFGEQLLVAVSELDEEVLRAELQRLIDAELIFGKGFSSRKRYVFKHALVQDTAYDSLLEDQRQANHSKVALTLERDFPHIASQQPEVLAHHFTEGAYKEKGVSLWRIAGQRSFRSSAVLEAKEFLEAGLRAATGLPSSKTLDDDSAQLQLSLAEVLTNLEGMASMDARAAFKKTVEISTSRGDRIKSFWSEFGLWRSFLTRAEYDEAMVHARMLERYISSLGTETFARYVIGATHFFRGEHRPAHTFLMEAVGLNDLSRSTPWVNEFSGEDPGINSNHFASINAWLMGYPDQARVMTEQAFDLAERTNHTYSRSYIATGRALLAQLMGMPREALQAADVSIRLSQEHGSWWWIMASVYKQWAAAMLAKRCSAGAVRELRKAIDHYREIGMLAHNSKYWILLAEAAIRHRCFTEAHKALERSMAMMAETGEGYFEAEAFRLRGKLMLAEGSALSEVVPAALIEQSYLAAMKSAQTRGARALELRAALDLGALYFKRQRCEEACNIVAGLVSEFTEGFDSPDLRRASRFLEDPAEVVRSLR